MDSISLNIAKTTSSINKKSMEFDQVALSQTHNLRNLLIILITSYPRNIEYTEKMKH